MAESAGLQSRIENHETFWSIQGVNYRNYIYTVDLAKSLLENGATNTQDKWAVQAKLAKQNNGFYTPDYPLFYNTIKAVRAAGGELAEQIRSTLKDWARTKWLMTLTRIAYQPSGDDTIIHNYSNPDKYEEKVDFVGADDFIKNIQDARPYQVFLGTSDSIPKIDSVFQWLNGTDAYIWRLNSKSSQEDERIARFDANCGGAVLGCRGGPTDSDSSLGVHARISS